jgi:hypothetical protein
MREVLLLIACCHCRCHVLLLSKRGAWLFGKGVAGGPESLLEAALQMCNGMTPVQHVRLHWPPYPQRDWEPATSCAGITLDKVCLAVQCRSVLMLAG